MSSRASTLPFYRYLPRILGLIMFRMGVKILRPFAKRKSQERTENGIGGINSSYLLLTDRTIVAEFMVVFSHLTKEAPTANLVFEAVLLE